MRNVFAYLRRAGGMAIALGAMLALAGPGGTKRAAADDARPGMMPAMTAAELVPALHAVNEAEIQAGRTAEARGSSDAVRDYGATLVRDHEAADEKLKKLAGREKLDVNGRIPLRVELALAHARSELAKLSTVGGQAFDHEFASMMLQDHQKVIQLVDKARPGITDPRLKALLGELEPNLREHEQIASNILDGSSGAKP
jgi:putative membrane protein